MAQKCARSNLHVSASDAPLETQPEKERTQKKKTDPALNISLVGPPPTAGTTPALIPRTSASPEKRKSTTLTAQNFLGIAAKKAKVARSAKSAARVGFQQHKTNKASHTGSGAPLSQVVRLKYIKGFTEAVRTPCTMEDLS